MDTNNAPTDSPTPSPTDSPTLAPTDSPTPTPTDSPTPAPTDSPTPAPTNSPTPVPTDNPTPPPTNAPTPSPTPAPTYSPTDSPTPSPTCPIECCCFDDEQFPTKTGDDYRAVKAPSTILNGFTWIRFNVSGTDARNRIFDIRLCQGSGCGINLEQPINDNKNQFILNILGAKTFELRAFKSNGNTITYPLKTFELPSIGPFADIIFQFDNSEYDSKFGVSNQLYVSVAKSVLDFNDSKS
eukprot:CAMPEP_0114655598 /NCGR_PEP_ID=MMETSP0191-20121206/11216_1 /TAXON_ID=126664 /ORGANISM="Sorites sp." /LENGTH=239 /DNA_ID=CAMNT_0001871397 /DNA_START=654 /DNA_END=1377 /DNA_ORIENTATION=+